MTIDFEAQVWKDMEKAISCGYCGGMTTVDSLHNCKCGRVLCENCGGRWGWCKDHVPVCNHPDLIPTQWNQPKPEPTKMTGSCKHNMVCSVCGYGWGCAPDPCEDRLLVESGVLSKMVSEAVKESPSGDWEKELAEM